MKKTMYFLKLITFLFMAPALQAAFPNLVTETPHKNFRALNKNLMVGSIGGQANVNAMGAFEYDIPLEIPTGSQQVQPQIGLHYATNSGHGELGHGWSISGLSQITRCGKTPYFDQVKRDIQLNQTDELALDGQRLMLLSGTALSTGAVYRFELENYSRVTITNSDPSAGPLSFELKTSDGSIITYGLDKSCLKTTSGIAYCWKMSKKTDVHGNYISYIYNNTDASGTTGEAYLDRIVYTGNTQTGLIPFNAILFQYAFSPNTKQYMGDHMISKDLILTKIDIKHAANILKTYTFKYFKYHVSQFSLHLKEIGMNAGGKELNSTLIYWGDETNVYDIKNISTTPLSFRKIVTGDFNGDGKSDYVKYNLTEHQLYLSNGNTIPRKFSNTNWGADVLMALDADKDGKDELIRLEKTGNGTNYLVYGLKADESMFEPDNQMAYPNIFPPTVFSLYTPDKFQMMPGDIDGDGEPDISFSYNSSCCSGLFQKPNISGAGTSNIFGKLNTALTANNFQGNAQYFTTDFNGNGVHEIFAVNYFNNTNNYAAFEYNAQADRVEKIFHNNFPLPLHTVHEKRIYPADFNGDGKTHLLVYNQFDKYWKLYFSKGKTFDVRIISPAAYPSATAELPIAGDFNMVFTQEYVSGNPVASEYLSTCAGSNNITFGDYNGDGMTDLAYLKIEEDDANDKYAYFIEVYYATGFGFKYSGHKVYLTTLKDDCVNIPGLQTIDYNGDSKSDLMISYYSDGNIHVITFDANTTPQLVRKVVNGYNNAIDITYQTLANNINGQTVYAKSNTALASPLSIMQSPFYVTASVSNPDGIGGTATTSYFYKDLVCHTKGKGMLGFTEIRTLYPNGMIEQTYTQWHPAHFYFPHETVTNKYLNGDFKGSTIGEVMLKKTSNTQTILQSGSFKLQLKVKDLSEDYVKATSTKSEYEYYPYNYLKKTTETIYDLWTGEAINIKTNHVKVYVSIPSTIMMQPSSMEEINNFIPDKDDAGNQRSYIRTKEIGYNNNGTIALVLEDSKNSTFAKTTLYSYNTNGSLLQKKTTVQGKSRTEVFGYDPLSINITAIKDVELSPILHKQIYYDPSNGLPITESDLLGHLLNAKSYDELNRMTKQEDPYGVSTNFTYEWSDKPNYLYKITQSGINQPTQVAYYDILGREVYRIDEGLNGDKFSSKKYNRLGQLELETFPEYASAQPSSQAYAYDEFGRVISITDGCGRITSKNYSNGRTEQTTDPMGRTTSIVRDAFGNIITSVGLDQETVQMTYNSQLKLATVQAAGSNTTYKYDLHGNIIETYNSNAGTAISVFNGFDLLVEYVDEKKNRLFYSYDAANRLSDKYLFHRARYNFNNTMGKNDSRNEHIQFNYYDDPSMHEFGLLKAIQSNRNYTKDITYTSTRLTASITENISGKILSTSFVYDGYGRLKSTTYPNGYQVERQYDRIGQFYQVTEPSTGKTLYTLLTDDGKGREILSSWGEPMSGGGGDFGGLRTCSIKTYHAYSPCMDFMGIYTSSTTGTGNMLQSSEIYNLEYKLDPMTGNISSRADALKSLSESFEYDNSDRLITTRFDNYNKATSFNYFSNGNIEQKSDIGTYHYDDNHQPHAVNLITPVCDFNPLCEGKQFIQYDANNRPIHVMMDAYQMNVDYNESGSRNHWALYQYPHEIDNIDESQHFFTPNPTVSNEVDWGAGNPLSGTGNMLQEKYYSGDYEEKINYTTGKTTQTVYIQGPYGITGVHVNTPNDPAGASYYIQKDHLGSFVALIDECGNIKEEYNYDSWGRRRNPYLWSIYNVTYKPDYIDPVTGLLKEPTKGENPTEEPMMESPPDLCFPQYNFIIDRGFTGQEHHDLFKLINLNARLYDPVLGRMLSPDPKVTNPLNAGDYNSYTYALNNPLKYTDPNGESPFLVAALIAVGIQTASYTLQVGFQSNWTFRTWNWEDFGIGVLQAGTQGILTAGIGQAFSNMSKAPSLIRELGRAAAHGGMNAFISAGSGEFSFASFIIGFGASAPGSYVSEATAEMESFFDKTAMTVGFSALSAGTLEAIKGGNFFQGAATGLIIGVLNHAMHPVIALSQMKENEKLLYAKGNYLVYEATYTKAGYRTDGHLILYSEDGVELMRIPASSGANNKQAYTIPQGDWKTGAISYPSDHRFFREKVGFAIKINGNVYDPARGREPSRLYIHPIPNLGSLGCIGLRSGANMMRQFNNFYKNYFQKYGEMKLNIILTK